MDHQAGGTEQGPKAEPEAPDDAPNPEIERLRERLAFYESFDRLIQENIARSGELLRESAQLRETATQEIAEARADAEQRRLADRAHFRGLFSTLLDEVVELQGQAERLARRLADTLDELETEPIAELPSSQKETGYLTLPPMRLPRDGDAPPWLPLVESTEPPAAHDDESALPEAAAEPTAAPEVAGAVDDSILVSAEEPAAGDEEVAGDLLPFSPDDLGQFDDPLPFPAAADSAEAPPLAQSDVVLAESDRTPASGTPRATIVLVHGVPRATTALSLKRYLEGLTYVEGVEPREFAEGVLRLEVVGVRSVAFDDLRGWSEGSGLQPLHVRDDLVEVRLGP